MVSNRVEWIIWAAVGLAAGIGLWFVSLVILMMAGFSFYAVTAAAFLELLIWLVAAPFLYRRFSRHHPQATKYRLMPLLAGTLIMILYFVCAMVITHPRAILPG